jgi:hypothetical protein
MKLASGLIILALAILTILSFQGKFTNKSPLTDMRRDNGAWFSHDTYACFAFKDDEIILQPSGPFSRISHSPIRIANDTFSYPQTGQVQHYLLGSKQDSIANIHIETLFIDGDGQIPPGNYEYGGWSHCNRTSLL